MSTELERLRKDYERYQAKRKQVENPLERVGQLQEELATLEASVTSPSGKVTVVAGPGGSIRKIHFAEDAVQQPASALAAETQATLQQAVAAAARKQARLVDEHMGGQLNAYDRVLQNQAEAFGTTVEDLTATLEQPAKAPPKPPRNEDDFSDNTLMGKGHRPAPPTGPAAVPTSEGDSTPGGKFLKKLFSEDDK